VPLLLALVVFSIGSNVNSAVHLVLAMGPLFLVTGALFGGISVFAFFAFKVPHFEVFERGFRAVVYEYHRKNATNPFPADIQPAPFGFRARRISRGLRRSRSTGRKCVWAFVLTASWERKGR
jgi:hypothetical protein